MTRAMNKAGWLNVRRILLILAVSALALVVAVWPRPGPAVATDGPLNFSVGVGTRCDSDAGPTQCDIGLSQAFTLDFKVNAFPSGFTYDGYDMDVAYSGNVTYNSGSLQQTGSGVWPGCVFQTGEGGFAPGDANTACAIGSGAPESTYTGVVAKLSFTCGASAGVATLTLSHDASDLVDPSLVSHTEAGASESLTINCAHLVEGPFPDSTCFDGIDNDNNGLIDAADPGCGIEGPFGTPSCLDGVDNDANGLVDAADPGCAPPPPPPPAAGEVCNGADDNGNGLVDEGFPDSDFDGIADCVDIDQDNDGVPDGVDNCPNTFNPAQTDTDLDGLGDACDPNLPPVINPASAGTLVVDGQFGPPLGEWGDVTPVSFQSGKCMVSTALDAGTDAIYLMYDCVNSSVPLSVGEEVGPVSFRVGNSFFDVFISQGGPNTNFEPDPATSVGGLGDTVRVLRNGFPFDNSAGCIEGAGDFNTTSPNYPGVGHNVFELEARLTGFPGGCYSPDPVFWSAALPIVTPLVGAGAASGGPHTVTVSQAFVHVVGTDTVVIPVRIDSDNDGCPDVKELGPNPALGGGRDPLNRWDYFNPSHDGVNRTDDILSIVFHYGLNVGDPGYDTRYDRTTLGPNRWNLGPPDGKIRTSDILASVYQYGHDCA